MLPRRQDEATQLVVGAHAIGHVVQDHCGKATFCRRGDPTTATGVSGSGCLSKCVERRTQVTLKRYRELAVVRATLFESPGENSVSFNNLGYM